MKDNTQSFYDEAMKIVIAHENYYGPVFGSLNLVISISRALEQAYEDGNERGWIDDWESVLGDGLDN